MAQTFSTLLGRPLSRSITGRDLGVIRWGPVWGGAMFASAVFALSATFWIALAYGTEEQYFRSDFAWLIGAAAIASYFLGGALAGKVSARTGPGTGAANSVAVWALGTIGGLLAPIPLGPQTTGSRTLGSALTTLSGQQLWITFAAVAIGLGAAVLGGMTAIGWRLADPIQDLRMTTPPAQRTHSAEASSDQSSTYDSAGPHARR